MGERICNLPIPPTDVNDCRTWLHNPHDAYTSKSTYSWLSLKRIGFGPHRLYWKIIWKLKMLPNVKVFSWRIGHDILPTRNKMVFEEKDEPARIVWERAHTLSSDFRIFNMNEHPIIPQKPVYKGWKNPSKGFIKINVDAAVVDRNVGYGIIARDEDGFVIAGSYIFENTAIDVVWAELKAVTLGLNLATSLHQTKIVMESDNATLINTLKNRDKNVTILGCCVNQECESIREFDAIHFNWIDRNSNAAADMLSKLAIKNRCELFNMDYPSEIHKIIINGAIKCV
ncbi:hypothetical protein J1N35_009512 [Gossypium stocksii]|uniref:RNase H type-1 domain-containing protein n=1 Tax=Gossypium stocksii TaxID=47602 RepID=A0A9D3VYV9_9ROSI|nr:hypothetical protein J1N35_009512 [Gossypium stocksii]